MKIKAFCLKDFKRFSDLVVQNIPATIKLVVLIGPNGCGKSSIFDAFYYWQCYKAHSMYRDVDYAIKKEDKKIDVSHFQPDVSINIYFHPNNDTNLYEKAFYFRTAYRNDAEFSVHGINKVDSPYSPNKDKRMLKNDATVSENYNRIISATFGHIFDGTKDMLTVSELREELIGKLNESLTNVFDGSFKLSNMGDPTKNGCFFFEKGISKDFDYKNLSGGEKAVFDLVLDMICKKEYYDNSIYCIDEPENHIHTELQSKLLKELYRLTDDNSQLWVATHSLGMMKEAVDIEKHNPGSVAFINFDNYNFDERVVLEPSKPNKELLKKMMEIALDDIYGFVCPETIVFCEGSGSGIRRKDFDSRCYTNIFSSEFSNYFFYSSNSCNDIENSDSVFDFAKAILKNCRIIKLIDKDDRNTEEISDLREKGIKVLNRRNLESYLLDDEIIQKLCIKNGRELDVSKVISLKQQALNESIERKNAPDDLKKASGRFYELLKKEFGLTGIGNNVDSFMRDTLSKLITPDTNVYKELKSCIFGNEKE